MLAVDTGSSTNNVPRVPAKCMFDDCREVVNAQVIVDARALEQRDSHTLRWRETWNVTYNLGSVSAWLTNFVQGKRCWAKPMA